MFREVRLDPVAQAAYLLAVFVGLFFGRIDPVLRETREFGLPDMCQRHLFLPFILPSNPG